MVRASASMAIKEKAASIASNISGITSILGSWQVCHSICLAIIAALAAIGITLTIFPLAFLIQYATPLWLIAAALSAITFIMYLKKPCISRNTLLFQAGILIFGIPFQQMQAYSLYFRTFGGIMVFAAISIFITDKIRNRIRNRKRQARKK